MPKFARKSSKNLHSKKPLPWQLLTIIGICLVFFIAYSVLSTVRHLNYQSFGYDLGINDQAVWRYSRFEKPITTIDPFPDKSKLYEHVELVYMFIAPFYWIWSSRRMLLLVQAAFVCSGGIATYLLCRNKKLSFPVSFALVISFLAFLGVQNAIWFDVHSISFAAAFLMWFLYFYERKQSLWTVVFFLLSITAKENIGMITLAIAAVYFWKRRDVLSAFFMIASVMYLFFIFFIYFPHIIHFPYLYQNSGGLLSNLNPLSLVDTAEKRQTILYVFFSYGFMPFINPLSLLPALADLATYFVIGSDLTAAQGLAMHYRITLAPLLTWATIISIAKYKKYLDNYAIAAYLLVVILVCQYTLHLPLSYLTKQWFWQESPSVATINSVITNYLPPNASVVAQNNIVPHISHRDKIYSLYPTTKSFKEDSPCGKPTCHWFSWFDSPEYLLVDTASDWDARHLLEDRAEFIDGLQNLEKAGVVTVYKRIGTTTLYTIKPGISME